MKRYSALVAAGFLVVVIVAAPVLSNSGWREVSGYQATEGDRIDFELRYRGTESVLIETRKGSVARISSCTGRTFVESYGDPIHTISREAGSDQECFDLATGSLFGFRKLRVLASGAVAQVPVDGRNGDRLTDMPPGIDWSEVILDQRTDLPLRAVGRDGRTVEWRYDQMEHPVQDQVITAPPPSVVDELYRTVTGSEAAVAAGLKDEPPDAISDLRFETAFSYRGALLTEPRYYLIWSNPRGEQVQFVLSPGRLPDDIPLLEDLGGGAVALNVQEGQMQLQIFATNQALLREAVVALRPEYLSKLP